MKIRSASPADEAAVTALWKECGLTVPYNDPATDFRFALGKSNSDILVTDDLSGSVMVGHDGHRGWLYYLAVAPQSQRQGMGRMLVAAAEQWLAARDIPKVQLMVRGTQSRRFKRSTRQLGFDLMPRINMQKWLKP